MHPSDDYSDFAVVESLVTKFLNNIANTITHKRYLPSNMVQTLRTRLIPGKAFYRAREQYSRDAEAASEADKNIVAIYNIVVNAYTRNSHHRRYMRDRIGRIEAIERLDLGGFFNPDRSNKQRAKELICAAIECIASDDSLSDKAKQSIVDNLEKVISEFNKGEADWTEIFGKLKETIFVLGAVGSLIGGVVALSPLLQAKQQLEEATKVIEETSIDFNYKTLRNLLNQDKSFTVTSETFMIEAPKSNKPLPLPHAQETDAENSSEADVENE